MRIQSILYMRLYKLRKDNVMRNVKVRKILDLCQTVSEIHFPDIFRISEKVHLRLMTVWLLLPLEGKLLIWEFLSALLAMKICFPRLHS